VATNREETPPCTRRRAAVVARGRTLTVYEEVHPTAESGAPWVEAAFLSRLRSLLPEGIRPILVADAGFRAPPC
jgi:hypothetical protein